MLLCLRFIQRDSCLAVHIFLTIRTFTKLVVGTLYFLALVVCSGYTPQVITLHILSQKWSGKSHSGLIIIVSIVASSASQLSGEMATLYLVWKHLWMCSTTATVLAPLFPFQRVETAFALEPEIFKSQLHY